MLPQLLKSAIRKSLSAFGLEVHRSRSRSSLIGVLRSCKNVGLSPETVIDVGAGFGSFDWQCYEVFPDARYVLIEPLEEYKNLIANNPKFSVFTSEDVINAPATLDDPEFNEWIGWYRDLYAL